jgi:hypothetical protein
MRPGYAFRRYSVNTEKPTPWTGNGGQGLKSTAIAEQGRGPTGKPLGWGLASDQEHQHRDSRADKAHEESDNEKDLQLPIADHPRIVREK